MKTTYLIIAVSLFFSITVSAQKLIEGDLISIPVKNNPGQVTLISANGYSSTRNGLLIPYRYFRNSDSIVAGYKYRCSTLDSLPVNDEVFMFIPGLYYNYKGQERNGALKYTDYFGNNVFGVPEPDGAWKKVNIAEKQKIKDNLVFVFKEICFLNDQSVINTISLKPAKGFYFINNSSLIIKKIEPVISMLNSQNLKDRSEAVLILGELKDKRAVDPLIHALKYENSYQSVKAALDKIEPLWTSTKTAKNEVLSFIASLQSSDANVRAHAAVVLGDLNDQRSVEPLIIALQYQNSYEKTITALKKIRPEWTSSVEARNAVPLFIAMLDDKDESNRDHAIKFLLKIKDDRVLPNLIISLKYYGTFSDLEDSLNKIYPNWNQTQAAKSTIPVYLKLLVDEDATIRNNADQIIMGLDNYWKTSEIAKNSVPIFISALTSNDPGVRSSAAEVLGEIKDDRAIEPLIAALEDEVNYVREEAVKALEIFEDKRAVEPLIIALRFNDSYEEIIEALNSIDRDWTSSAAAKKAVPLFMEMLKSRQIKQRREAALMLGKIKDNIAVEALMLTLKDEDEKVRDLTVKALSEIKDTRIVEPLILNLKNEDRNLRESAARILGNLGDKRSVGPLIDLLKDYDNWVRAQAALSLMLIKDSRAVEPLISVLKDKDFNVKYNAISALGEFKDNKAVKPLIAALKDKDEIIRNQAALSLGQLHDHQAIEPLIQGLRNEENYLYPGALNDLDPDWINTKSAKSMVPVLITDLKSNDQNIRCTAATLLGYLKDNRAVEPLTNALNDDNKDVRRNAAKALEDITGKKNPEMK